MLSPLVYQNRSNRYDLTSRLAFDREISSVTAFGLAGGGGKINQKCTMTNYEAVVLTRYWVEEILKKRYSEFLGAEADGADDIVDYASRRLGKLRVALGDVLFEYAFRETHQRFMLSQDPVLWGSFLEWNHFDQIERQADEQDMLPTADAGAEGTTPTEVQ